MSQAAPLKIMINGKYAAHWVYGFDLMREDRRARWIRAATQAAERAHARRALSAQLRARLEALK
jgi:hypothetical protein